MKLPRLPRFSLLTLLLAVLLIGSVGALYVNWDPWKVEVVLEAKRGMYVEGFSPSGKYVLAGGSVWDARTGKVVLNVEDGELSLSDGKITGVTLRKFLPKTDSIIGAPEIGDSVYIIDIMALRRRASFGTGRKGILWAIEISPDEKLIWLAKKERQGVIRSAATGEVVSCLQIPECPPGIDPSDFAANSVWSFAAFSPSSKEIAAIYDCSRDRTLAAIWDAGTGRIITQFKLDLFGLRIEIITFTPDGQSVILANTMGNVCILDTRTGELRGRTHSYQEHAHLNSLRVSPNSKNFVTTGYDGAVRIWDVARGEQHMALQVTLPNQSVETDAFYSPDGRRILASGFAADPSLWDSPTGERLWNYHGDSYDYPSRRGAAFSHDGRRVLASSDQATRIWKRVRPEEWWGIAWLPEFWTAALIAALLIGNLVRNARGRPATQPA